MSQNIYQIFQANPASSMISTDILYLGRSPYNTTDDFAITFANFVASIGTATPTASTISKWDANINFKANSFVPGFTTTATATATTVLTVTSTYFQFFTGTLTQTVLMPVASTLALGQTYYIANNSSGVVTVQSSGTNTIQAMAAGTTLELTCILTSGTGVASWQVLSYATGPISYPISLANGGTNASLTASVGGIFYSTATAAAILSGTATAQQMLQSGASGAPAWSIAAWPQTTTINQLLYSSANNLVSGLGTANSATLYTSTTGVPAMTASMTNGQILLGSTGANPVLGTLTAGTGISIINNAGSVTVSGTGGGMTWTVVAGTSSAMAVNNGYVSNNAGLVTFTLPATAAVGTMLGVAGLGAGGWKVAQNASQLIHLGGSVTTTGVGGSLASTNAFDSLQLLCVVANTTWIVLSGAQGIITVV